MSDTDRSTQGVGGRYGTGAQNPTPNGIADESDTAGRVGADDVGGPSGDITGSEYDRNPSTGGQHQSRDYSDDARTGEPSSQGHPQQAQDQRVLDNSSGQAADAMEDWEIDHSTGVRKAHLGKGDHFVGNAAETLEAPITNEPADQTRPHGNRTKHMNQGALDHN
jgi:hypothetical protein